LLESSPWRFLGLGCQMIRRTGNTENRTNLHRFTSSAYSGVLARAAQRETLLYATYGGQREHSVILTPHR
jgi:hypothetical protein